jgi:hypothetical protein
MCKRFSFLISLVLVLCLVGSVCAQTEVTWDNNEGAGDRLWDTASNWDLDRVPAPNERAVIDSYSDDSNGPIIQTGINAVADYVETGYWASPPAGVESVVTMTGGTLTAGGWIDFGGYAPGNYRFDLSGGQVTVTGYGEGTWEGMWFAFNNDTNGVLNMSAGDVNVFGGLWLGWWTNSHGIFNMTGGTYTGDYIYVGSFSSTGGSGRINLHGGTIHCSDFAMGPVSHLNISGGVLTCDTDLTVANGWIFDKDTPIVNEDGVRRDAPGYTGTLPTLVARGRVTAYDVNSGDIITDDVNYPSEAGLRALVKIDYDETNAGKTTVWADAIDPNLAYNPNPFDKARRVQPAEFSLISWSAGTNAAAHDVYFGTDEMAVENANTSSDEYKGRQAGTSYAPDSNIPYLFGADYFWRIDEVNSSGGVEWPGSVWSFTAADYGVVDDFDSYANTEPDLDAVWNDYWDNGSDAIITLEKSPDIVHEGNSVAMNYYNITFDVSKLVGSWMDAATSDLDIGSDWTVSGAAALVLYFRGSAGNSVEKMWVELEDTSSNAGYVLYDGDANDITVESWHEWNIDQAIFDACGVTLTALDNIKVGVGGYARTGQTKKGTSSNVYFDDFEVWPRRCIPKYASIADLTDDCIVDAYDVEVMFDDWLESDGLIISAPPTYDPDIWLKFDEGTGQVVTNSGLMGTDYNGQLGYTSGVDVCDPTWVTNDPCSERLKCLEFDGTNDYVQIPDINLNSNTVTITAWIKRNGTQTAWAGIVTSREGTSPESLNFGEADELRYTWNNDGTWDFDSGLIVPDGLWTFVALVVEPEQATLYMSDGTTWDSATNAIAHIVQTFDGDTAVGRDWDGRNVAGRIDDVRIYNKNLGLGEILGLAGLSVTLYDRLDAPGNLVPRVPDPAVDPNYYPSNPDIVNFNDYDVLADDWLTEALWP